MKRHLTPEESDESRSKSRRILDSRNREEEEEPGGFLDLNSTPRGFDLNAPVAEEDSSHGQSGWLPAQDEYEGKEDTAESQRLVVEEVVQSQIAIAVESDARAAKSEDSASSIVPLEADGPFQERETEEARINPKEACDEPEIKPAIDPTPILSVLATSIIQRTLEPLSALGIDDDLDIIRSVWSAHQKNDLDTLDSVVFEACEELAKNPSHLSRYHYLSCLYISKKLPEAFGLPKTSKVLVGFLRSAAVGQPTGKRQMMLPVLASKLLLRAFVVEPDWPLEFVQIYLEDATVSRSWIEHEGCKEFVSNVLTAFPDVEVLHSVPQELSASTEDSTVPRALDGQGVSGELVQGQAVKGDSVMPQSQGLMASKNRYPSEEIRARVRTEFLQALNQLLGSASTKDNPRQLLKLLMQGAGYEEVRVVASSMLEGYLNNPVHLRAAKALLDRILQHTRGTSDNDLNTVANLLALRITSMQPSGQTKSLHGNIFGDMVTQLVKRRPEYTTLALKTFVTAEINNRNPHNLKSIVIVLKAMQESPPPEYELALILQELAANDDYRLQLRDLMRRMMKQVGPEIDVHALCHGLMQPWPAMGEQHEVLKETWLKQLVDLSCQLLLYAAVPFALDESVVSVITSSPASVVSGASSPSLKEKLLQLEKFSLDTASFQVEAVAWCTDVLAIYLPSMDENQFTHIVRQLLFLETSEVYCTSSENVSELDLLCFRLVSSCLPAPEEILARLILMAISNYPVSQGEALKLIEQLVWRAASLKKHIDGALTAASVQLPAAIFKLASFNLPGVTRQPVAQLVVKDMYWRACLVVLIIAAYNPSTIGWFVWENLPTIRCLMEALLTCTRTFLPIGVDEVRFSEVNKLELEAEQRDTKAEEAISAFLDVTEKRRNDPSSTDIDSRGAPVSSPGSRFTSQGAEWKGKVMFLNQTGPIRRPPKSAVDELDRVDTAYQLGHFLRRSRSPDFFAEITKQQTLPQAWPWLQKILVQAPDVVTYLPPVWQCELLFMYEGQHPLICNLSLDIGKLHSHLQQVMVQQVQTKEGEIERVVDFLSHKLVAKSGIVRVRARRCFSCLFDMSPSNASDHNSSLPDSPPDNKRMDPPGGAAVNVIPPVKVAVNPVNTDNILGSLKKVSGVSTTTSQSSNMNASAVQIPSSNLTSLSGAILRVSPGASHVSVTKDGVQDRAASWTQASTAGDDCGWLDILEKLSTASRIVSVLAPAIQRAIQQENSIPVVMAYLEFLRKHLTKASLACCLSTFVVQRKMVASSLLLGLSTSFVTGKDEADSRHVTRGATIDLVLESLCQALELGTVNDWTCDELALIQSPVVTLVLPRMAVNSKDLTLLRVKVHKIVADAALEVLSLLSQEATEDTRIKQQFQQLLNLLFPISDNADQTWRWDVDIRVGWLEEGSGKRPLLSELQAMSFVQSKNTRLVKAGLSVLSMESKLELCESFGLSSEGAAALLTDLNRLKDMRLGMVLGSGSFGGQRVKKLSNCVKTIVRAQSKGGANLLRVLEQSTAPSLVGQASLLLIPASSQEKSEASPIELSKTASPLKSSNHSVDEICVCVFKWLTSKVKGENSTGCPEIWGTPGYYVQLRQYLQKAMIGGWDEGINHCLKKIFRILEKVEGDSLADSRFLSLGLPILALISQHPSVMGCNNFEQLVSLPTYLSGYIKEKSLSLESLLDLGLQNYSGQGCKDSGISASASVLLKNLAPILVNIYRTTAPNSDDGVSPTSNVVYTAAIKMRESVEVTKDIGLLECLITEKNISLKALEVASVDRIEPLLRCFLYQKLSSMWEENSESYKGSVPGAFSVPMLGKNLVYLLRKWRWRDGLSILSKTSSVRGSRDQVGYSGRCGLIMEMLGFLDPEFQSEGLLTSILDTSRLQTEARVSSMSCAAPVALAYVVHNSSWNTLSKIFHLVLGRNLQETTQSLKPSVLENGNYGQICSDASSSFYGGEVVMEFISLCVQHPRAKSACRLCDERSSSKLMWSWLDPLAARILTKHAVSACVAAKLGNIDMHDSIDADGANVTSSSMWIQRYVCGLEGQTLCPHSRCLRILLLAASQGSHIMRAIVQHLSSYEESVSNELSCTIRKTPATIATKAVAHGFLQGLYLAFPVSVKAVLHSSVNKLFWTEERRSLNDIHSLPSQTCSLNTVVHSALRSICNGNEKESNAAYGFCQEFARQHPLLVIPHLLTLRLLLKELLPLLKQGEPQARSGVVRAFSMGLGLLDALRPYVILISNSKYKRSETSSLRHGQSRYKLGEKFWQLSVDCPRPKTDLEELLDLYFQILWGLDIQDRSLLAKIVARLSDFLCHCVAVGGRSREYVAAHRTPILETTAQTFSKLKKIGFLLSLLDKPEVTAHSDEVLPSGAAKSHPQSSVSYPQPASSSIVLDDILKVRTQLQQCIKLHTGETWEEQGLPFYSTGKSFQVSQMSGNNSDEGNLSATLNDLERASARMPAILSVLEDSLVQLTMVKDVPIRERIYNLLERSLLHCPSEGGASNIVQGLLQQLRSSDVLRAKSAARNASRFFHFSPELQESILLEMLQLGRTGSDELQILLQGLFSVAGCPKLQESILLKMLQLGRTGSDELQILLQGLFSFAGCPSM